MDEEMEEDVHMGWLSRAEACFMHVSRLLSMFAVALVESYLLEAASWGWVLEPGP